MFEQTIIIPGQVISKKNSQQIFKVNGRPFITSSAAHKKWEKASIQELMFKRTPAWCGPYPCELRCFFFRKTKQKFDYSNMIESVQDMLVKAKIIEDDSYREIIPVVDTCNDVLGMSIDKDHPRVVVRLVEI